MRGADVIINFITKGTEKAGASMQALRGKIDGMSTVAKGVALAFGVALTQGIRKSVEAFMGFDDAMTQSLAIMNTTVEQQKAMEKQAMAVARETTIGAEQSAEAYFFLASAGLDAEQSISALPQVAKFAQAGMFDMATATDLATDAQSALGLTVNDAQQNLQNLTRVTDVLVKGNQLANASVQQFSEALTNKSGAALKVVNKDIEEGVAVLSAFADRGVKGAEAGEKLNQILRDIPRATAKNGSEFAKLNLNMFDTEGNMKNVADIVEELDSVLGPMSDELKASTLDQLGLNRGVADAVKILSGAGDQIREYESALRSSGGATQEVADNQMNSLASQVKLMNNAFSELGILIGDILAPALTALVQKVTKIVQGFSGFINKTRELNKSMNENMEEAEKSVGMYGTDLPKAYNMYGTAIDETIDRETDFRTATQRAIDMAKKRQDVMYNMTATQDIIDEALERHIANQKEVKEVTEEVTEAIEEQAEQMKSNALPNLNAVIQAQQNLSDIYKEQDRLLGKREDASIDLAKAQRKEDEATQNLELAKEKLNEVSGIGAKVTEEEALAILRQQERVQELTDIEDKSEIQKLELAVAQNRLNALREDSISLSKEELDAIRGIETAERQLKTAQEKVLETQEKLNEATEDYNEATAKTPANLIRIASAKKALDEALENQKAMGTFAEAIQEMVDMGLGSFDSLRSGYMDMLKDVGAFKGAGSGSNTSSSSSTGASAVSEVFNTEGGLDPSKALGDGLSDFDRRNRDPIASGPRTTINLSMTGLAVTQAEVTESVAEVIRRARNEGLDIG